MDKMNVKEIFESMQSYKELERAFNNFQLEWKEVYNKYIRGNIPGGRTQEFSAIREVISNYFFEKINEIITQFTIPTEFK